MGQAKIRELSAAKDWPRELDFTISERIWLVSILPREGDIISLRILRILREDLSFSEAENDRFKMRREGLNILWDAKAAASKRISFGKGSWELVQTALTALEKQKKLNDGCLSLYEKFVGES